MMRFIGILILLSGVITSAVAKDRAQNKQERLIANVLSQQVRNNISIRNSVSSILSRYPEKVDIVLAVALEQYPNNYKQVMLGALSAEPVLACDVIATAMKLDIASNEELLTLVLNAEPAYAQEIVSTAIYTNPDDIENIVHIAIKADPFVSKEIVENSALSYPTNMLDVLSGAITAIPEQTITIVKELLSLFPDQAVDVVKTAVSKTHHRHDREIVNIAIESGLSEGFAIEAAIAGGANKDNFIH